MVLSVGHVSDHAQAYGSPVLNFTSNLLLSSAGFVLLLVKRRTSVASCRGCRSFGRLRGFVNDLEQDQGMTNLQKKQPAKGPGFGREAPRMYGELASWWPLLSSPADYLEEAAFFRKAL